MTAQTNPFRADDKVLTKVKGEDVEAVVRLIYNNEVQVRTPDGLLRWRTVKTVRHAAETGGAPQSAAGSEVSADVTAGAAEPSEPPGPSEQTAAEAEGAAANSGSPVEPEPSAAAAAPLADTPEASLGSTAEAAPCGVPEIEADRKRGKKSRRRR